VGGTVDVLAPVSGIALPMTLVPDPVFAQSIIGPGVAVRPEAGTRAARAPVSGTLVKVMPHAFVVLANTGQGVLVHLGINTVKLLGKHFTVHRATGDTVTAGDVVTTWDTAAVAADGYDTVVPVVVLDAKTEVVRDVVDGPIDAGGRLFTVQA
jgi:PTS system N-acetylglucosamine-specific IIA component